MTGKPQDPRKTVRLKASESRQDIDRGLLSELVGYHLRRAQAAVFDDFMRTMAVERVTPGQFGVLMLIGSNRGLNQSTLAKALGIERSTMVAVITGLESRGLVERRTLASDRRANSLALTPPGEHLLAAITAKVRDHEKNVTSNLSKNEVQMLINLLKKIKGKT